MNVYNTAISAPLVIVFASLVLSIVGLFINRRMWEENETSASVRIWLKLLIKSARKPFLLVAISYAIYLGLVIVGINVPVLTLSTKTIQVTFFISKLVEIIAFFWFILLALNVTQFQIQTWATARHNKTIGILLPMVSQSLRATIVLLMVNIFIPALDLTGFQAEFAEKLAKILLIGVLAWIFVQVVNGFEKLLLTQYSRERMDESNVRKIQTQTRILKKIIITLGMIVAVAAVLMVFDSVRRLGTGLLTTAGILSAVGAFASQQSIGRTFAGLQLAFSQPIKIGDTVIIENEFGEIEEISLSYVIVKLWDLRRLVLPTDYFSNKPFQNLTRTSSELVGTVFLYVDYIVPLDLLREELQKILTASTLWDKKISQLQVTAMTDRSLEIRILVSAANSGALFDLRCEVREQLVNFITKNFPSSFPVTRNINSISE